jgi:hypothetical protein
MSFIFAAPRSLAARTFITVELAPRELHRLIRVLEEDATKAADDPNQLDFADFLFQRIAS